MAIDLSQDWTNSTVAPVRTHKSSDAPYSLNFQALWSDEKNERVYIFGGEKSGLPQRSSLPVPPEAVWGLSLSGNGSGTWDEYVGSTANAPFPQGIVRPTDGFSVSSGTNGYFFGGLGGDMSSTSLDGFFEFLPGIVTLDFDPLGLTNTTNVAWPSSSWIAPGQVVFSPAFGKQGVLVVLGGGPGPGIAGGPPFNNITIYDIDSQKWLWQLATGNGGDSIPDPRNNFCAVGVQGGDNSTFEMWVLLALINEYPLFMISQ